MKNKIIIILDLIFIISLISFAMISIFGIFKNIPITYDRPNCNSGFFGIGGDCQ